MLRVMTGVFTAAYLCLFTLTQVVGEEEETAQPVAKTAGKIEYRLLATSKTSSMQKEMSEAAAEGYRLVGVMGGATLVGDEVVAIMRKDSGEQNNSMYEYQLLATTKTSTMQKELQEAADNGFEYKGQTVFETTFGGDEVVVILERNKDKEPVFYDYKLLATQKTGTMQKELTEAGNEGFEFVGLTVSSTTFGGNEVVSILRRERTP